MARRARMILLAALVVGNVSAAPREDREESRIRQAVREVRQSDTETWRKVSWAPSLLEARRLARAEGRPVFLFTLDGNLDTGRC
jgi:hypothetical protein